jgi:hypothetical protein
LARKAASLAQQELVGHWLWGVARRTAQRVKVEAIGWQRRQCAVRSALEPDPVDALIWRDLRPVLDEEIHRLPAKYRQAFVLCYLEGTTNAEAARKLGCPPGTVFTRLARARALLRHRLTRRGITLAAAWFGTTLTQEAMARVPAALARSTIQAATVYATGGVGAAALIAPQATRVAERVLRAVFLGQAKVALAALLAMAVLGSAGTRLTLPGASVAALDQTERSVRPSLPLVAEGTGTLETEVPSAPAQAKSEASRHEDAPIAIGMGFGAGSDHATATVTIDGRCIQVTVQGSRKLAALARPEVAQRLALTNRQRDELQKLQTRQQHAFQEILPHHPIKAAQVPGLLQRIEQAPATFREFTKEIDSAIDALLTNNQRRRLQQMLVEEQPKRGG